jgi:hypothetical protein
MEKQIKSIKELKSGDVVLIKLFGDDDITVDNCIFA